ncbi:HEAT repeat domain-containing protein [Actinokineospora enzanensis]|uniref:HEAT repeat domain-containing protein n=1 Tax=Actinokineospora enzanensis TaxID=155975 RepID=UPI0012ECA65B|nr:HEAT repeat domain-containing protein [Actinokineospora enzanensis]
MRVRRIVDDAALGRSGAADELITVLFSASHGAQAARTLLAASPSALVEVDFAVRRRSWPGAAAIDTVRDSVRSGAVPPLAHLIIAGCHRDGHVRQSAVAALDEALPLLALRAADWVPQVREQARSSCLRHLDRAPAEAFTALAPMAFAVRRRRHGGELATTLDALLRDGPPDVLAAGLSITDHRVRRAAYTAGIEMGRLGLDRLLRGAASDRDTRIRLRCADAAVRTARATGDLTVPRLLLTSGSAAARAEAVHMLALAGDVEPALAALTDRVAIVRATGQAALRRAGADSAGRYRAMLAERTPAPAVIAGLGETGTPADADLLLPWLSHPGPRGRVETIRALCRWDRVSVDLLLPLLVDPAAAVTRQATRALRGQASTLDEPTLRALLATTRPRHVRAAALQLLRAHGPWTRIGVDLALVADPDLGGTARADLVEWLDRGAVTAYSQPTGEQAEELDALLTAAEGALDPGRIRLLRFHLGLTR